MWLTRMGYRLFRRIYDVPFPVDAGDFKLLSRRVVDHLVAMSDRRPFVRGMIAFIGFKQVPVPYVREPRRAGETKCPLFSRKVIFHSILRGLIAYSDAPLLLAFVAAGMLGVGAAIGFAALFFCGARSFWPVLLLAVAMLLGGVLAFLQGVQNLYLLNLRHQCRGHPLYIVQRTFGFEHDR